MSGGKLLIVSGPSGVGKTTICEKLLEHRGFRRVVTCTTRPARKGEIDGRDYRFLTEEDFKKRIKAGEFLEHALVHGHYYGTPREPVEKGVSEGRYMLLNIDVQGTAQIRGAFPRENLATVFLLPPTQAELEQRLTHRLSDTAQDVEARLETARKEILERDKYDHIVINGNLEDAVREILACIGWPLGDRCPQKEGAKGNGD